MKRLFVLLLLLPLLARAEAPSPLAQSSSPYLRMHADDPVHWHSWGREVLELARRTGKPIYISSGYFSCHWCHVMQRESYKNPEIARLLNQWFIPVKVDRELAPALDDHLIDFVQRTRGSAGWPLNVFLTPEGYPIAGMSYLPPDRFRIVLERMQKLWSSRREEVTKLARQALTVLQQTRAGEKNGGEKIDPAALRKAFVDAALKLADELDGGFGQQAKFPMAPQLDALLQLASGNKKLAAFLRLTLDQMASRGLRDHLGGGFFRYTIDPQWTRPHYEKMLYSQALLAILYLEGADKLKQPGYRRVAFDTLDFVLRHMKSGTGGYVASFSAVDGNGVEGGYYLWRKEELKRLFTEDELPLVLSHWRFVAWKEGREKALPLAGEPASVLARRAGLPAGGMAGRLEKFRQRLLRARDQRVLPVDDKQLAGWNGLLLVAFSRAARVPDAQRFALAAKSLAHVLVGRHWDGKNLWRTPAGIEGAVPATLQDYAFVAWGLTEEAALEGKQNSPLAAILIEAAWRRFHGPQGWRGASQPLLPGMPTVEAQEDGALPSPVAVLLRLSLRQGGEVAGKARESLGRAVAQVLDDPFWYASTILPYLKQMD